MRHLHNGYVYLRSRVFYVLQDRQHEVPTGPDREGGTDPMSIPDFTIVLGLDAKHFEQLKVTWPTWKKNKPSLLRNRRVLVFCDKNELSIRELAAFLMSQDVDWSIASWPPFGVTVDYGTGTDKWDNPQRHKMLAGFLHVAAEHVVTTYWLKLDTDALATGMDDWIDPEWFEGQPGIIAPSFGYTKPPNQMERLDVWADVNGLFENTPPLNLHPEPGATLLKHPRICGWCDFFETEFTDECARLLRYKGHKYTLPEPSLDGLMWYCAVRMGRKIRTIKPKSRGWDVRHSMSSIREAAERAMA